MNHLLLLILCFLSVELFIRFNCIDLINSIINVSTKSIYVLSTKSISDHWKENIIPIYSLQLMKSSIQMLLVFLSIIFLFLLSDKFFSGLIDLTFSRKGIIESMFFAFSYSYLRKIIFR